MDNRLMYTDFIKRYFSDREYEVLKPRSVSRKDDTVFVSAGIQPILSSYRNDELTKSSKIFLAQPVIRTQYADCVQEGSSVAFVNPTSSGFNISEREHKQLVSDWIELFYELGMKREDIHVSRDEYSDTWGDLELSGKREFFYYKDTEIGDATFFTKVTRGGEDVGIDTMSDLGFGLERVRWCLNPKQSYYDLYTDSSSMSPEVKASLSVLALLAVNDIRPSNKNTGYRARLFSKKLAGIMDGVSMPTELSAYLLECIDYWKEWQENKNDADIDVVHGEYIRNCNRIILDKLIREGYTNLSGININISKDEFKKRFLGSGVELSKIDEYCK